MSRYVGREEETARALRGGWLHTGDSCPADDADFLFFVDRNKQMIRRGGLNISSAEVEGVLLEHPGVVEVAVVPMPTRSSERTSAASSSPPTRRRPARADRLRRRAPRRLQGADPDRLHRRPPPQRDEPRDEGRPHRRGRVPHLLDQPVRTFVADRVLRVRVGKGHRRPMGRCRFVPTSRGAVDVDGPKTVLGVLFSAHRHFPWGTVPTGGPCFSGNDSRPGRLVAGGQPARAATRRPGPTWTAATAANAR